MQQLKKVDITQLLYFIFYYKIIKASMSEKRFGIVRIQIIATLQALRRPRLNPPHKVT
jgi:hypothetical protein